MWDSVFTDFEQVYEIEELYDGSFWFLKEVTWMGELGIRVRLEEAGEPSEGLGRTATIDIRPIFFAILDEFSQDQMDPGPLKPSDTSAPAMERLRRAITGNFREAYERLDDLRAYHIDATTEYIRFICQGAPKVRISRGPERP
ncbi:hypothetical protein DDZ18_05825 [Marinicauda salina]|uniref:Uncharacterized protein n=1 Tax=Marinicauda salina TaxID=2135793 RepID=A0A2U2BT70_9PROT|nr:hypothetical protein [Marinicauda salina]PWE17211.1 hypothetical protein DDZ18_05825 [Marinicauda salina]